MKLVATTACFLTPTLTMACPVCDKQIALTEEQGTCLLENVGTYLEEAELIDPVSINILACDGRLPDPDLEGTRTGKIVVADVETAEAELVSWYFLSAEQLRCLQQVLPTATYGTDDLFEFTFSECPS